MINNIALFVRLLLYHINKYLNTVFTAIQNKIIFYSLFLKENNFIIFVYNTRF